MAVKRKVSHYRRIIKRNPTRVSSVNVGDIVSFNYRGPDIYDRTPLVFVLEKTNKIINGINLNYMKEYKVQTLLKEVNLNKMKRYDMYKDSFRTYFKYKITMADKIEYKADEMLKEERRRNIIEN